MRFKDGGKKQAEKKRNEAKAKIEVSGCEKDRRETNKAVLGMEHKSTLSEQPVNPHSSIIERMPKALLLPTQSQCQQHYKYQDTLNRFFRDSFKANSHH